MPSRDCRPPGRPLTVERDDGAETDREDRGGGVARADAAAGAQAVPDRRRAGAVAPRSRRAPRGARDRHPHGRRPGRAPRRPAGADALALLRGRPGRAGGRRGRAGGAAGRPDLPVRRLDGCRDRDPRARLAVRAGAGRRARLQHRDRRRPGRGPPRPHPQAPHPGHRGLLRGQVLPPGPGGRGRCLPAGRARRGAVRAADLLGPVVPGARPRLQPRRRRGPHLPDRDRLRARPPRPSTPSRSGSG